MKFTLCLIVLLSWATAALPAMVTRETRCQATMTVIAKEAAEASDAHFDATETRWTDQYGAVNSEDGEAILDYFCTGIPLLTERVARARATIAAARKQGIMVGSVEERVAKAELLLTQMKSAVCEIIKCR